VLFCLESNATVTDSPIAKEAFNELVESPLKLTVKLEVAATLE